MKIKLQLNYQTNWGQSVCVCGSIPELGSRDENRAVEMVNNPPSAWSLELETDSVETIEYYYLIKEQGRVVRKEWGSPHKLSVEKDQTYESDDLWQDEPTQKYLYTSGFSNSFFHHELKAKLKYYRNTLLLNIYCPYVRKDQLLVLSGESALLGDWSADKALPLTPVEPGIWQLAVNAALIEIPLQYKLAIYDTNLNKIDSWEEGANRILLPCNPTDSPASVKKESLIYRRAEMNWKAAGVAIPVFSLRSEDSFGIGEFSDLKKMVDWAAVTGQQIIQILPVNDTTVTYTWIDSYPYNAISTYALHPIYLGLKQYPLRKKALLKKYMDEAAELNKLDSVDYDKVMTLKFSYLRELFAEIGEKTLASEDYKAFYTHNEAWLFPYACFCYLRDKHRTANHTLWKNHSGYDRKKLEQFIKRSPAVKQEVNFLFFIQYLLHQQLTDAREYANRHNVILKGDIPIGINLNSVEAWTEPHLFNLGVQTGAPPDDFSFFGQNWGFPTYNWEEMAKDGYLWWKKRFRQMANYFDAYRIDHILGFFRIWEIPLSSVQGLLGYFSPALPLSVDEMNSYGFNFDEDRMTKHYVHDHFLGNLFGVYTFEAIEKYLQPVGDQYFQLREDFDTQAKVREYFMAYNDDKANHIRDALYSLCNEVLFIKDKNDPTKYHPRITAQYTFSYQDLEQGQKDAFNRLYDDFFFRRHNQFWREQALRKLPPLISSTSMLVCGEDLGMVPDSVPPVMHELQILSLELERMPKFAGARFSRLSDLPYLSVCTTSTHDMSPLRLWWKEERNVIQSYYNDILQCKGVAPEDCDSDICWQIVNNHLQASSMLTILPLQDWLSVDDKLKRPDPGEERINIPAISRHYWKYRMHLTLEELINATAFNQQIRHAIEASGRS
ncbi:MAG: 4-alpha-glucanotransferase [Prevotella sp.]|jgi:4-alpha-glucanotransferase|nr:4-alpha-glucanotransferase [Prevotella sp.]